MREYRSGKRVASSPLRKSGEIWGRRNTRYFILGPNPWAQFKATDIDQWECPIGQIGRSLGPKGFILRPVPIFPCLRWHITWRGFGGKELGPCQKLGWAQVGDPIHQLGPNLCTCMSTVRFDQSRVYMSKLNHANNLASNIKPLGLIDGPIE